MKRCPKCQRTYQDDNQKFCTVDGGRLESSAEAETTYDLGSSDLGATVLTNQSDLNRQPEPPAIDLNKTMASLPPPPTGEINRGDSGPATSRTIAGSFQPAEPPQQPPTPATPPQYRPTPDYQQQQQPPQQYQQPPGYQPMPPQQQQPYQQPRYQQPQPPSGQLPSSGQLPHGPGPMTPGQMPQAQQQQSRPPQPQQQRAPQAERKGSRLPLILGAVVLLLLLGGGAAYYFLVLNKKETANGNANTNTAGSNANDNTTANTNASANTNANMTANANTSAPAAPPPYQPPPDTTEFVNSRDDLTGRIADHFVPFSFYYPDSWELDSSIASGGTYFVKVERKLPPDFTQERCAIGWYESKGTYEADKALFSSLVEAKSAGLKNLPGYEKLSEGPTKVNSMDAYQFTFKGLTRNTEKGDITFWGRIIFVPPGKEGEKNGLQLTILTSSLAPELKGVEDVGVKGELPVVLESLRFKK